MTRPPFGFGPADRPEEPERGDGGGGNDPFGFAGLFGGLPGGGGDVFATLQSLMSWSGGPVNWDLAKQVAGEATRAGDRPVTDAERREVVEACRLADVWLDGVTALPASGGEARAWSRTGWLESTTATWRALVDPVAARVVDAMGTALQKGLTDGSLGTPDGLPPEVAGMLGGLGGAGGAAGLGGAFQGVMQQVGGVVFGAQVGQALGALAGEVVSTTEVGLPLGEVGRPALLPANVAAFGDGLEVPLDQVRLYLALRECASQRLFAHVPWLRAHLFDAVEAYARGIDVDLSAIEQAVGSFDPSDPESLQRAVGEGMFDVEPTPAQQAALARLETALALVEGWVDAVVDAAASGTLPAAVQLREAVRRRRATGGPAEQTFQALVGLQLRPKRLREAAALWSAVAEARGTDGRDALWGHPDLLPGPSDLDDPAAFVGSGGTDWDAELQSLADGGDGGPAADGPAGPDGGRGSDGPDADGGPEGPRT